MKCQRRRRHAEPNLNVADRQTIAAGLDQQAQDVQTCGIAELRKESRCRVDLHAPNMDFPAIKSNHLFSFMVQSVMAIEKHLGLDKKIAA
jgi:hypothetical protein